jgi:hypothetical protein
MRQAGTVDFNNECAKLHWEAASCSVIDTRNAAIITSAVNSTFTPALNGFILNYFVKCMHGGCNALRPTVCKPQYSMRLALIYLVFRASRFNESSRN